MRGEARGNLSDLHNLVGRASRANGCASWNRVHAYLTLGGTVFNLAGEGGVIGWLQLSKTRSTALVEIQPSSGEMLRALTSTECTKAPSLTLEPAQGIADLVPDGKLPSHGPPVSPSLHLVLGPDAELLITRTCSSITQSSLSDVLYHSNYLRRSGGIWHGVV